MLTRKTLLYIIYLLVAILGVFLTKISQQILFLVTISILYCLYTYSEYIIVSRKITWEQELVKKKTEWRITPVSAIIGISILLILFIGFNLLFKLFTIGTAIIWFLILALNYCIQYILAKNKTVPIFYIEKGSLIYNELFVKRYSVKELNTVVYDEYDEEYILRFSNKKELSIKKEDFEEADIHRFLSYALTKSQATVSISENIRNSVIVLN